MLIPLGTDRPLTRPTVVTHLLVWVNVLIFALQATMQQERFGGWDPDLAGKITDTLKLDPLHFHWWALFSSAFIHANFLHIAGNMVFLWVFGPNVEDRFGRIGFLAFYLAGAAASGGLWMLFQNAPVLGASGAIAAVTGAYLVLFPRTEIRTFLVFLYIGVYRIPAPWFLGAQVFFDLAATGLGRSGNVATLAHLGGYAFGIGVSLFLLATGLLKREVYDLFSITKHRIRRREFQELAYKQRQAKAAGKDPDSVLRAKKPEPLAEAVMQARGDVTNRMVENNLEGAAAAYRRLLEKHGRAPSIALLNRRSQYDLANYLFKIGDHQTAATAYALFMEGYPTDPEIPVVRLMLGLINARYLNDPVKAKREISEAIPGLPDGDHKSLARELLAELG